MTQFKMEHNVATGEILEIPLTEKEIKELEALRDKAAKEQAAFEAAKAKAETAKAAQKQLLLDRLGITQEEAQLLLGGN